MNQLVCQINRDAPRPGSHNPKISKELDELIMKATSRRPKDRPQTAELLASRACTLAEEAGIFEPPA